MTLALYAGISSVNLSCPFAAHDETVAPGDHETLLFLNEALQSSFSTRWFVVGRYGYGVSK